MAHTFTRRSRTALAAATALAASLAAFSATPSAARAADAEITPGAAAVTASTSDENVPAGAVDGDLGTRWSGEGDGAWLQLDLGAAKSVNEVKLATYRGDSRRNLFQLQYWTGSSWQTVVDGRSSGTGKGLESFAFDAVTTSKIRYVGHGYQGVGGADGGAWNSLTEVEVWGAAGGDDGGGDDGGTAKVPADVLDLTNWKQTLPIGEPGHPTEIQQPALDTYSHDPYFKVVEGGKAVQFQAPVNGVTTSGSKNPRSELREMKNGGKDKASWSATSGTHTLTVREAFTHLPEKRPYVVGAQIHGGDDDVTVFRLEGTKLYVTKDDTTHHQLVDANYKLGTVFEAKFVVKDGKVKAYYNGELKTTIAYTGSGNYFKAGAYTQANCGNTDPCSSSNYGETRIHELKVQHS